MTRLKSPQMPDKDVNEPVVWKWMNEPIRIKPLEHRIRWLDSNTFQIESDIMTMGPCEAKDIWMAYAYHRGPVTYLNERPKPDTPAKSILRGLQRLFGVRVDQ
jgi:hypothetical protein